MVHEALVIDPARDAPLLGVDLHLALGEVAVEHQIGRTALPGIGEAQVHAARGGRHFGRDAVVERHLVVVGLADLVRMAELRGARLLVHDQLADFGHERIDGVVAHPRAALVGLLEAADLVHGVLVFPPFAVRAGLRRPGVHGVGHRRGGIGVAVAQFEPRIGSLERVHVLHVVALLRRGGRQGRRVPRRPTGRIASEEAAAGVGAFRSGFSCCLPVLLVLSFGRSVDAPLAGSARGPCRVRACRPRRSARSRCARPRELLAVQHGALDVDVLGRVAVRHDGERSAPARSGGRV